MEEKKNNQKTLTIVLAIALAVCAILAVVFGVKSNKVSGLLKESTEEAARLGLQWYEQVKAEQAKQAEQELRKARVTVDE